MRDLPSPAQSAFCDSSPLVKRRLVEVLSIDPARLKNDRSHRERRRRLGKRVSLAFTRLLITFCTGAAAALAWLSHSDATREAIASSFPQLGWLAWQAAAVGQRTPDMIEPAVSSADHQLIDEMSLNIDAVWQRVDQLSAGQEQMTHDIEQLTAGQEQLTLEITKLHLIEQYILYKNSEPPLQRAIPAPAHKRSTQLVP
jgi:hypothetical protein